MTRFVVLFVIGATTVVLAVAAVSLIGSGTSGVATPEPTPPAPQTAATAESSAGDASTLPEPAAPEPSPEAQTATAEAGAGDGDAPAEEAAPDPPPEAQTATVEAGAGDGDAPAEEAAPDASPEAQTATAEAGAGDGDAPAEEAAPESPPPEETTAADDGGAAGAPAKLAAAAVVVVEGGSGSESASVRATPVAKEPTPPARAVAREEGPVADSGGRGSVAGSVHMWQDGDRTLRVRLQADLTMGADGDITSRGSGGDGAGVRGSSDPPSTQPVFRSESGALMTLPGGVLLVLDATWSGQQVDSFFARNSIAKSRVSDLGFLPNGFFVETAPGFPSLNLANALAGQDGVEISSPNWWTESTTR